MYFFPPEKLAPLLLSKEVKPSPDLNMVTVIAFDNLFPLLPGDILSGTRSTMTAAIMFSRQDDAGSRACLHYMLLGKPRTRRLPHRRI